MDARITNIHTTAFAEIKSPRDEPVGRSLNLDGEHLGVRIEVLPPGSSSSYHHYHSAEEEHVLLLEGNATLYLGDQPIALKAGDQVLFPAGNEVAHHIENRSNEPVKYLVFGERKADDIVFYPEGAVMLVKSAAGHRWYDYVTRSPED